MGELNLEKFWQDDAIAHKDNCFFKFAGFCVEFFLSAPLQKRKNLL